MRLFRRSTSGWEASRAVSLLHLARQVRGALKAYSTKLDEFKQLATADAIAKEQA
jgi:hypothetical protein